MRYQSAPRHAERREEPRFPARLQVTLLSSRAHDALVTVNVSFRGMMLESRRSLGLRQLVRLGVKLPATGDEIVLHAMVMNVTAAERAGAPERVGVQLYGVDRATRQLWWSAVRHIRDELGEQSGVRVRHFDARA